MSYTKYHLVFLSLLTTISPLTFADSAQIQNPQNSHLYKRFDSTSIPWATARSNCEALGGYLATITSSEEQRFINQYISTDALWYYIGGISIGGKWQWVTGEPWSYENWDQSQPFSGEYLFLNSGNLWMHRKDSSSGGYIDGYICEWTPTLILKKSWKIPAVDYCNDPKFNKGNTLTAASCFNTIASNYIKLYSIGKQTKLTIQITPNSKSGGFFFKSTFPSQLHTISINTINTEPLSKEKNSQVAEVFSLISDEIAGKLLGSLGLPIKLFTITSTTSDPSVLENISDSYILTKQLYPYQTVEYNFQRTSTNAAVMVTMIFDIPYNSFVSFVNNHGMSFYFGGGTLDEMLVEKLSIQ